MTQFLKFEPCQKNLYMVDGVYIDGPLYLLSYTEIWAVFEVTTFMYIYAWSQAALGQHL